MFAQSPCRFRSQTARLTKYECYTAGCPNEPLRRAGGRPGCIAGGDPPGVSALARLLHPDNQSDPKLKSAAERQMIQINEILVHEARGSRSSQIGRASCTKLVVPEAAPRHSRYPCSR